MSYDLFFLRKQASSPVPPETLTHYFGERAHYTVQKQQFWYRNESTGVYFSFDLASPAGADGDATEDEPGGGAADGLEPAGLSFNINYCRPHFFGLEAEGELSALVSRFSLSVDDPQNEGMGRGEYSRDGFLRGWNAGNLFGHSAYFSQLAKGEQAGIKPPLDVLPAQALEQMWSWNFHRRRLQAAFGEEAFVPGVQLVRHEGRPKTLVVWGDAIPEAIPEVDLLCLVRHKLAPRRLLARKKDACLVPFDAARPLLSRARRADDPAPHYVFSYREPPDELIDFFRSRQPFAERLEGLPYDSVLTKETLESAKARVERSSGVDASRDPGRG